MPLLWAQEYDGVPPAEAFAVTAGLGTAIIVNKNTGIAYYYKTGTGVQAINSPSAAGISDHGGLTGLSDDDHTQYHNDTRGDARYTLIAHTGAGGTAHAEATPSVAGFLGAADKTKLDALQNWTYVVLLADYEVSSTTPAASLLAFTPAANSHYLVEGQLFLESADAAVGPCPGISWPSGLTIGAGNLRVPLSSSTEAVLNATAGTDARVEAGAFPGVNTPYLALLNASFQSGAAPSGDFSVTLSAEV